MMGIIARKRKAALLRRIDPRLEEKIKRIQRNHNVSFPEASRKLLEQVEKRDVTKKKMKELEKRIKRMEKKWKFPQFS